MTTLPTSVRAAAAGLEPVYIYDLALLRERLRRIALLPIAPKRIHFATMANDHETVLHEIAATGTGAFVNSLAHLALALRAGFPPRSIIYSASNMSKAALKHCIDTGVHLVLDSIDQIAACDALAPHGLRVGLRVNVGSVSEDSALGYDPGYRFGVLPGELPTAAAFPQRLKIVGLHCYFGTDIMDHRLLLDGLGRLARLSQALPDLAYLDGGGGFGISDDILGREFDIEGFGEGAAQIMRKLSDERGRAIELVLEPGRWLVAPIGWFFATVIEVKRRDDRVFAGVNASIAQFPRMLVYPETARHPCIVLGKEAAPVASLPTWITGNSTYSRDFLSRAARLPELDPGDTVAFANAGAYCRSMRTRFLGMDNPREIILGATHCHAHVRQSLTEAVK